LGVDGVVCARDLGDGLDGTGDGRVPAVVVLWCQAGDDNGAVVEGGGEGGGVEQLGDGEAVAFDPVLFGEIDGREGC
jgi:hypothetical protein